MFAHIVCWKVKDEVEGMSKPDIVSKMKSMLEELPDKIEEIVQFEVGKDIFQSERSYDLSLYSTFNSEDDFRVYQQHPDHQIVVEFFKKVVDKAVAVDYRKRLVD